jgi:hypothetical protein
MNKIILTIGGEEREFYFGLGFLGNFIEQSGVKMHEIDSKIAENPFKWIPEIMFHSYEFGFIRKNEICDSNAFDVADWIDNDGGFEGENVKLFFKAFQDSLVKNVPLDKKKVTAKKK